MDNNQNISVTPVMEYSSYHPSRNFITKVVLPMENQIGIEALENVLQALHKLATSAEEVMADGKVSLGDISEVPDIIAAVNQLLSNLKGCKVEIADLTETESIALGNQLIHALFKHI